MGYLFFVSAAVRCCFGGIIVAVVGTEVATMKHSPKSDRVGGKVREKLDDEVQLPLQFVCGTVDVCEYGGMGIRCECRIKNKTKALIF
ncbi:hypothetical protein M5D96_008787, partial [Drosophila gunungcola]